MTDIAAIAASLSEPQRVAITLWEDATGSPQIGWLLDTITDAEIQDIRELGLATKPAVRPFRGSRLTPLGQAVANHLRENNRER